MNAKNGRNIYQVKIYAVCSILLFLILAIGALRETSRKLPQLAMNTEASTSLKTRLLKKQSPENPHPSSKKRDYIKTSLWQKGMRIYRDWWTKRQTAIYVAEMDRDAPNLRFGAGLSNNRTLGRETISSMARRWAASGVPILAAVNAGFGIRQDGRGRGGMFFNLHIQDWELISIPPRRNRWGYSPPSEWGETCFGVTVDGEYLMDAVQLNSIIRIDGEDLKVGCINQICDSACQTVIYTPRFGAQTLTRSNYEITLTELKLPLTGKYRSRFVIDTVNRNGNSTIPRQGIVLSLDRRLTRIWNKFVEGATGELNIALLPTKWQQVRDGMGGDIRLLRDGKIEPELVEFHQTRGRSSPNYRNGTSLHPRSAMGFNDKKLFLMVIDGRQRGYSMGMTFYEMAEFFQDLGVKNAINLDGGSSSTLWGLGGVINRPSHGYERRVFNIAAIVPRKDGKHKSR